MDSIVTTTSLDLTIPNRSRAANSIALGSFVNRWISRCRPWLASRSLSISDSIFCRWAEDAFNSARDRMTAVQQMAVVARTIVVKITQDGSARAPLMTGSTSSRAVKVGLLIIRIGWATVGLLAARLSSHSVFPKLCKRHLQYVAREPSNARLSTYPHFRHDAAQATALDRYAPRSQLSPHRDARSVESSVICLIHISPCLDLVLFVNRKIKGH